MRIRLAVDHGNVNVKTPTHIFPNGIVNLGLGLPQMRDDFVCYNGDNFIISAKRLPLKVDKSVDIHLLIMTFFALAKESASLKPEDRQNLIVDLGIGLPPDHIGRLREPYKNYFRDHRQFYFTYNKMTFSGFFNEICIFPQAFSAIASDIDLFMTVSKFRNACIVDIGGHTTDVITLHNGRIDYQVLRSLNEGTIKLYHKIIQMAENNGRTIKESTCDDILLGEAINLPEEIIAKAKGIAKEYTFYILSEIAELEVDLLLQPIIFVGGGSSLLLDYLNMATTARPQIVANAYYVTDPHANSQGYLNLMNQVLGERF